MEPQRPILTGLDIDDIFARTDASGTSGLLVDGLGSTIEIADASGALQTHYTFEPYGKTSATGSTSTNAQQFTGRELDGTGAYYYRTRYYDPGRGRFLSEDSAEFAGQDVNLYRYVWNNPTLLRDPFGLGVCRDIAQYFRGKLHVIVLLCEFAVKDQGPRPPIDLPKTPDPISGPKTPGRPPAGGPGEPPPGDKCPRRWFPPGWFPPGGFRIPIIIVGPLCYQDPHLPGCLPPMGGRASGPVLR